MNKKVFSGVGHGGSDKGAIANGLYESEVNLVMAKACNKVLTAHGVENPMSRYTEENDPLQEEIREANDSEASIAIDFHNNAGGGDGFEAFHSIGDMDGKRLCECIEKYVKALGQNSRGIKTKVGEGGKDYFGFIRETKMTAIIIESFFLDSADRFIADTIAEQEAFGVAIAKGILEYLGVPYNESKPVAPSVPTVNTNVDVFYQVYANGRWLPEVKNLSDYAGIDGQRIQGIKCRVSKGDILYRVRLTNGKWLPWVRNHEDYAGIIGQNIDCIQIRSQGNGKKSKYRVRLTSGRYLPWVVDYNNTDNNGYAGINGYTIDRIELSLI